jgi:hypothetical protein
MTNQNGSNLLNQLGGVMGARNRLDEFSKQFANSTNQTPQQVGQQIQQQMSPEQFQMFASIADMIVGRRN